MHCFIYLYIFKRKIMSILNYFCLEANKNRNLVNNKYITK